MGLHSGAFLSCVLVESSLPREPAFLSSDFQDGFTSRMMLPSSTSDPELTAVLPPSSSPQPGTSSNHQGFTDNRSFDAPWLFRQPPSSNHGRQKSMLSAHPRQGCPPPTLFHNAMYPHQGQVPFHHRMAHGIMGTDVSQLPHTTSPEPAGVMKKRRSSHFSPDSNRPKKSPDLTVYPRCRREHVRRSGACRYSPRPLTSQQYVSEQIIADSTNSFLTQSCPVDLGSPSASDSDTSDCDSDIDVINPGLLCSSSTCRPARPEPFMPLVGEEDLDNYANSTMPPVGIDVNLGFHSNVPNFDNDNSGQLETSSIEPTVSRHSDTIAGENMSMPPRQHVIIDKNDDTDSDVEVVAVVTR